MTLQTLGLAIGLALTSVACEAEKPAPTVLEPLTPPAPPPEPPPAPTFSAFGPYEPLPAWSGWCGASDDPECAAPLVRAVSWDDPSKQTPRSRGVARRHGWHLWAGAWAPIQADGFTNDPHARLTNLYGTTGCWSKLPDGGPACGGTYPIWLTWPNNGAPMGAVAPAVADTPPPPPPETLRANSRAFAANHRASSPDPTVAMTVDPKPAPVYPLPPLVLVKACGVDKKAAASWIKNKDAAAINQACGRTLVATQGSGADALIVLVDGTTFVNQGDVMIATESLSAEAYADINEARLYDRAALDASYQAKAGTIAGSISEDYVSTKHMFWPVKGCRPDARVGAEGCRVRYGALPPWDPTRFRGVSYATDASYHGYETWGSVVAIDTCPTCGPGGAAELVLEGVTLGGAPLSIRTAKPSVYEVDTFQYVQLSNEALEGKLTVTDRALLDQATIWAYGEASNGFEPGDFLVVAAMHVNTKEIPTWAFQSVWWTPMSDTLSDCPLESYDRCFGQSAAYAATDGPSVAPNRYSGLTGDDIALLDRAAGSAWRKGYALTDSYGIRYELDGAPVNAANYFPKGAPAWATTGPDGQPLPMLPVSMNVYIEPVIHPLGTNCHNCHQRAGFPSASCGGDYASGCGAANYQTAQCPSLLGDYGDPTSDPCFTTPWAGHARDGDHCREQNGVRCDGPNALPVVSTDFIFLIADGHLQPPPT
jgi:hypothetical protein